VLVIYTQSNLIDISKSQGAKKKSTYRNYSSYQGNLKYVNKSEWTKKNWYTETTRYQDTEVPLYYNLSKLFIKWFSIDSQII